VIFLDPDVVSSDGFDSHGEFVNGLRGPVARPFELIAQPIFEAFDIDDVGQRSDLLYPMSPLNEGGSKYSYLKPASFQRRWPQRPRNGILREGIIATKVADPMIYVVLKG